jgi:hypothetical protein
MCYGEVRAIRPNAPVFRWAAQIHVGPAVVNREDLVRILDAYSVGDENGEVRSTRRALERLKRLLS